MDRELSKRAEKLLKTQLRVFYHASFDDPEKRKEILGDLPEKANYEKEQGKLRRLRNGIIHPEMRPCYESPLLDFKQEQHLFRQMNYYKYQAQKLLAKFSPEQGEKKIVRIERLLEKITQLRNRIAECNFRLATQVMKCQITFYREHSLTESLLSDAYLDVLKAVDYFNWTLGNKFSTYATWVCRKNFFRDNKLQIRNYDKLHNHLEEATAESIQAGGSGFEEEKEHQGQKNLIRSLIDLLSEEMPKHADILEDYFGIKGKKGTLASISKKIGVSKERVRQIKEEGLTWIRDKVKELDLNYEAEVEYAAG